MRVLLLVLVLVFLVQDYCLAIQSGGGGAPWTAKEMKIISKKISTIVQRPKATWNRYMKLHPNETIYQFGDKDFEKKVKSLSKSFKTI